MPCTFQLIVLWKLRVEKTTRTLNVVRSGVCTAAVFMLARVHLGLQSLVVSVISVCVNILLQTLFPKHLLQLCFAVFVRH